MEQIIEKSSCKEFTIFELMGEISRLKLENEQLRNDNIELHNRLNENNNICLDKTLFEGNNPDNGYDEEELMYAYAIADKNKKFV